MVLPAMYEWFDKAFVRDDYAEPEESELEAETEAYE
jgi:hypothetical protein